MVLAAPAEPPAQSVSFSHLVSQLPLEAELAKSLLGQDVSRPNSAFSKTQRRAVFSGGVYLKLQGSKLDECRESMAERHWPNEK